MTKVGIENSYNYLVNLGVSTKALNADGVGLALGTSGITVIEMAGAYGCIANGGTYLEPLSFSKVVDNNGNTILDANEVRETRQVYKPSSAYMLVDALTNAANSGTGWRAKLSGITTAGKTGTNHGNRGVFFAGMTGYYTSTIWIGHDEYKSLPRAYGGDTAAPIWKTYMQKIHEGLSNKSILEGGAGSYGVVTKSVCSVSGKIPHEGCPTKSDYFPKDGGPDRVLRHACECDHLLGHGRARGHLLPGKCAPKRFRCVYPGGFALCKALAGAAQEYVPKFAHGEQWQYRTRSLHAHLLLPYL